MTTRVASGLIPCFTFGSNCLFALRSISTLYYHYNRDEIALHYCPTPNWDDGGFCGIDATHFFTATWSESRVRWLDHSSAHITTQTAISWVIWYPCFGSSHEGAGRGVKLLNQCMRQELMLWFYSILLRQCEEWEQVWILPSALHSMSSNPKRVPRLGERSEVTQLCSNKMAP